MLWPFKRAKRVLGVDIRGGQLYCALLSKHRHQVILETLITRDINEMLWAQGNFNELVVLLNTLVKAHAWQGVQTVVGIPIERAVCHFKQAALTPMDNTLICKALPVAALGATHQDCLMVAYDRPYLTQYVAAVRQVGLTVSAVDMDVFSVMRLAHWLKPFSRQSPCIRVLVFIVSDKLYLIGYQQVLIFFQEIPNDSQQRWWQPCQTALHRLLVEYQSELEALVLYGDNATQQIAALPYTVLAPDPFTQLTFANDCQVPSNAQQLIHFQLAIGYALRGIL